MLKKARPAATLEKGAWLSEPKGVLTRKIAKALPVTGVHVNVTDPMITEVLGSLG